MGVRNYNCSSKFTRTIKEIKLLCRPVLRFHLLLISFCLFVCFFSFVFPSIIFLSQFVRKITLNLRATRKQHVSINWQLFCVCHFFFCNYFYAFYLQVNWSKNSIDQQSEGIYFAWIQTVFHMAFEWALLFNVKLIFNEL